jgi:heptosyltransferase II
MNDPILIVPYMWIGDFVRCHTIVKLLKNRNPTTAIDVLTTRTAAPILDYMPGVRKGIAVDLPRRRLALRHHLALAKRLRTEGYGQALVMPRTWKSALAPCLAGIPIRTGFLGEARFGLINDLRPGERRLPRMVDRCAALALARNERVPGAWPAPELRVPATEISAWQQLGLTDMSRSVVALAPGAVGPSKRWPIKHFAAVAENLANEGHSVWIVGGPQEKEIADEIAGSEPNIRDLTGPHLRNAILALAAAQAAVSNDSGLLHVAAAVGTPSIGIFGPTSPWHWAPLNPISAVIEPQIALACRPCHRPVCRLGHHRCMQEIAPAQVMVAIRRAIDAAARQRG